MERETQLIETSGGHKAELKTYITGRERQYISEPFLREIGVNVQKGTMSDVNGKALIEANDRAIETLVVSLDGSRENVFNRVMDLREEEFNEICAAINATTDGKKKDLSIKQPSPTSPTAN